MEQKEWFLTMDQAINDQLDRLAEKKGQLDEKKVFAWCFELFFLQVLWSGEWDPSTADRLFCAYVYGGRRPL